MTSRRPRHTLVRMRQILHILGLALLGICGSVVFWAVPLTLAYQEEEWAAQRKQMVTRQIEGRGVKDSRVLAAMRAVPRHRFVPQDYRQYAYRDSPLPIGRGQTISQPYIVAFMTELAEVGPDDRVLEIGTGSGYQAAVLGELTKSVWSIEIDCELAKRARADLDATGYKQVVTKCGDGYAGWSEHAPFDAILVTAAAPRIPQPLKDQLAVGGVMVIPVGEVNKVQVLVLLRRTKDGFEEKRIEWVRFVPMTGEVQKPKEK